MATFRNTFFRKEGVTMKKSAFLADAKIIASLLLWPNFPFAILLNWYIEK